MSIQSHTTSTFQFGSSSKNTCSGDSGGPAIESINGVDTVVGTTSYGDQNCTQLGVDMRVDANRAFISQYAGSTQPTPTPTSTATPTPTPNPTPTPSGNGDLSNGVPVTGLSGASGSQQMFTVDVPSGATNLNIAITGSTSSSNDVDLYVKFGSAPTLSSYDCRPYVTGSNESCPFATPQAGTYYVMLNGYTAFSGVTLTATWTMGGGGGGGGGTGNGTALQNGVAVSSISGAKNSDKYYYLSVPSGATTLTVTITGSTSSSNDADLYLKFGATPTKTVYDCRPYRVGSNETCTISNPSAGAWDIMLDGYTAYSGVKLTATYQ